MLFLAGKACLGSTDSTVEQENHDYFENQVRPLLHARCYKCHSIEAGKRKGGLYLDSRDGWATGGDSGPAITPGDPSKSLLIRAISYQDPDLQMPPKSKLTEEELGIFKKWVELGAPDPRTGSSRKVGQKLDIEEGRRFWSFLPIADPDIPLVNRKDWPTKPLDHFILKRLETEGLNPVDDAGDRVLLRRVYYDLTGLPPTLEAMNEYLIEHSPHRYSRLIDRLLNSNRFGEKWGRHWLDLARYSDSTGGGRSAILPNAWRYRNYVIDSFNHDKPFNRFIREQIAGDLMTYDSEEQRSAQLIATGFLSLGPKNLDLQDKELLRMNTVDEQIDTVGQVVLGMTIACARCHDHKFDPIPATDYYALAGIFRSTLCLVRDNISRLTETTLPVSNERQQEHDNYQELKKKLTSRIKKANSLKSKTSDSNTALAELKKELKELESSAPLPLPKAIAVSDEEDVGDYNLCIRGNVHQPGPKVRRGFLQVSLPVGASAPEIREGESGRRELADWLTDPAQPLTARVFVNRVWHHLFGLGLVATVDNFGRQGRRPTHPELLDFLARRFMNDGWSTKQLIRRIVLSRTYRLSSQFDENNSKIDPEAQFRWRMNRRRLSAEEIRDTLLAVSGNLHKKAVDCPLPPAALKDTALNKAKFSIDEINNAPVRSVYLPVFREEGLNGFFEVFDFANPGFTSGKRHVSTLPAQALFLMNSPWVMQYARDTAQSLLSEDHENPHDTLEAAFQRILGRPPLAVESRLALDYLETGRTADSEEARREVWPNLIHSLFASLDFRYLN
jgi:hypothetical protein